MDRTPEAISQLIDGLQSSDELTRAQAAFALGMLGEPAIKPLIQLLSSPISEVRMRAAWALGVIGAAALPALVDLAEGDDQVMRVEAIRIMGVIGEARALNQLLHALTDSQPQVASRAARALGKLGDPRIFHPLLTALQHPSADVRYEACRSLGDLHIMEAIPVLRTLVEQDTTQTSWGASVAEAAQRAIAEIESGAPLANDTEFARVSKLLQEYRRPK